MEFRTQYDRVRVYTNSGTPEHVLYNPVVDKTGFMSLKATGKDNFYDYIQSFADSVDIHVIISRFVNGDTSVLNARDAFYADLSEMPTNYADMVNVVRKGEEFFNSLPVEVRAEFNHDPNQFLASLGTEKFAEIFNKMEVVEQDHKTETEIIKEDVEENE